MQDPFLDFLATSGTPRLIPCGGNGGDQFIRFATGRLVAATGASFAKPNEPYDYLAYPGGGLFGFYEDLFVLEALEPGPEPLVFFPRACQWISEEALENNVAQFERLGRPVRIFSRDPVSAVEWESLTSRLEDATVELSHDVCVLYESDCAEDRVVIESIVGAPRAGLVGLFLREDRESAGWTRFEVEGAPSLRYDPSRIGYCPPMDSTALLARDAWLPFLSICLLPEVVITDRLHVMLARWVFERDTILLPCATHKIRSAWEHSISPNPKTVVFARTLPELGSMLETRGLGLRETAQRETAHLDFGRGV